MASIKEPMIAEESSVLNAKHATLNLALQLAP
jgi:hypothetical protein